jgi:tetratricopeptide (TPR) repeat protein
MRPTYIDRADAEKDALTCAAFVAERIKSNDGHADALLQVISRYLSLNESDLSAQLADTVADNFSRDNLLRAIAEHCAGVDDDEYAMQLADAIDDPLTRASAMERIALVKAQKQQFEKSMEIAETLENPQTVYSQNAFHHAAAGDDRAAENLFTKIDFPPLQAQTCIEIASAKLENEDNEGAVTWLERADRIIPEIFTDEERVNEYLLAAYSFIRAGRNDRAITLLSAARELVENSDTRNWRDQMYSRIADYYFQAGSSELADRALDRIEDNYWFALALEKFAAYKIKDENIDDAAADLEEAANLLLAQKQTEIYNTEWRDTLLRDIALGMVAVGNPYAYRHFMRRPRRRRARKRRSESHPGRICKTGRQDQRAE